MASYGEFPFDMDAMTEFLSEYGPMIVGVLLVAALVFLAFGVLFYVLTSLGFYTVAKRRGISNPWLAWIPIGTNWILGSISDQYRYVVKGEVKNKRIIMIALPIASFALSFVLSLVSNVLLMMADGEGAANMAVVFSLLTSLASTAISIATIVFHYMALYDYYTSCSPNNNVLFLVLGIFFGFLQPFFIFFTRKKDGGMPPRRQEPQYVPAEPAPQPAPEVDPWDRPDNV